MKNIICLLAICLLLAYGCLDYLVIKKPVLVLEGVSGEDKIWLSGCYGQVSGYIKNTGNTDAENVEITCTAKQEGATVGNTTKNIGALSTGSQVPFSIEVDTDCLKGAVTYSCNAKCNNCQ